MTKDYVSHSQLLLQYLLASSAVSDTSVMGHHAEALEKASRYDRPARGASAASRGLTSEVC